MDNAGYASLTRQAGLRQEMDIVAHNLANVATDGFQKEGLIFAEHVAALEDRNSSLSMARAEARVIDRTQGQLVPTGGQLDFAIEGDGYFMVETADGQFLTRQGSFSPDAAGNLVAADGARLLDAGGAPVFVPPDARTLSLGADGTLSADDRPLGEIGLFMPPDPTRMSRASGVRFAFEGDALPIDEARILQGFVEASNVNPILEVARMIEVQRAYERSKNIMSAEDERIRAVVRTLGE